MSESKPIAMLIYTPQALDAAYAAGRQGHREKLMRASRNQRILTWVAFGCCGCMALFASLAYFFVHDVKAARSICIMAIITFALTATARRAGRKKAVDALREVAESK